MSKQLVRGCLVYIFKVGLFAAASSRPIRQIFGNNALNEGTAWHWSDLKISHFEMNPEGLKETIEKDSNQTCGDLVYASRFLKKQSEYTSTK